MASNAKGLVVGGTMIPRFSCIYSPVGYFSCFWYVPPPLIFYDMVAIFCLIRLSREKALKVVYSLISLHGAILL